MVILVNCILLIIALAESILLIFLLYIARINDSKQKRVFEELSIKKYLFIDKHKGNVSIQTKEEKNVANSVSNLNRGSVRIGTGCYFYDKEYEKMRQNVLKKRLP